MKKRNPCKQCDRRAPGCHGGCDAYKDWRKELDERNAAVKESKDAYNNQRVIWTKSRKKLAMKDR